MLASLAVYTDVWARSPQSRGTKRSRASTSSGTSLPRIPSAATTTTRAPTASSSLHNSKSLYGGDGRERIADTRSTEASWRRSGMSARQQRLLQYSEVARAVSREMMRCRPRRGVHSTRSLRPGSSVDRSEALPSLASGSSTWSTGAALWSEDSLEKGSMTNSRQEHSRGTYVYETSEDERINRIRQKRFEEAMRRKMAAKRSALQRVKHIEDLFRRHSQWADKLDRLRLQTLDEVRGLTTALSQIKHQYAQAQHQGSRLASSGDDDGHSVGGELESQRVVDFCLRRVYEEVGWHFYPWEEDPLQLPLQLPLPLHVTATRQESHGDQPMIPIVIKIPTDERPCEVAPPITGHGSSNLLVLPLTPRRDSRPSLRKGQLRRNTCKPTLPESLLDTRTLEELGPIEGLREALKGLCGGSLRKAYNLMDLNGNGVLSVVEFQDGLTRLRVPWMEITGLKSIRELFHMFDANGNGQLNLREVLGFDDTTKWEDLPEEHQWSHYVRSVSDMLPSRDGPRAVNSSGDPGEEARPDREAVWVSTALPPEQKIARVNKVYKSRRRLQTLFRLGVPNVATRYLHHSTPEGERLSRVVADDTSLRCQDMIKSMSISRRHLQDITTDLYTALANSSSLDVASFAASSGGGSSGGKHSEMAAAAEKVAMERARVKAAAASGLSAGSKGSMFGRRNSEDYIDKVTFFATVEDELPESERNVRRVARKLGIPILDAEEVYRNFLKMDEDESGVIERDEFEKLLLKVCKVTEMRQSKLDEFWRTADKNHKGALDFVQFLIFYWRHLEGNPLTDAAIEAALKD